ncbi:Salmolysin [Serratia quinivorans]|jgi:MarR family transcriptional regulator for hemolysin|uniref:MarR family winged helix-turn-helix transcriptional regulator n=1 Tax=Serratia quinivorans TaxID=137545 RepID=UPI002178A3F0|nr:MarR family transcriptional regulator [Serratia quinivorans]CAI0690763.1 Salmolysin [Serratia quinivorans]CAI0709187.1 Salmolysin [Serratia quinivorans]CAI0829877.1 Salmolysin [Serratia quinivorans]CAI0906115.1 Salmolysin [Serratia quinivorans]CAI0941127.1 Salmolysin [Serratia quinivorans]
MPSKEKSLYALTNALQPVRRVWKQAATLVIAKTGISMSLATVVLWVHRNPQGINQRDLAEEVGVNPGALVRLLDQAAALGFLERQELPGDRRFKTLRILPTGAELAKKIEAAADKLRVELMHDVPLEDIETATRILRLFEERASQYLQQTNNEP